MVRHRDRQARNQRQLSSSNMQIEKEVYSQQQEKGGPCTCFCRNYGLGPKDSIGDMSEVDMA
eukprot:10178097-Ditylum_brightwellii.AAC.1